MDTHAPHTPDPDGVGRRIREAREKAKLSISQLAGAARTAASASDSGIAWTSPEMRLLTLTMRSLGVTLHRNERGSCRGRHHTTEGSA